MVWQTPAARRREAQLRVVTELARANLEVDISASEYGSQTSHERGVGLWVHQPMVAALDLLNAYEARRKAVSCKGLVSFARKYHGDARTRVCEVLKQWLRSRAQVEQLEEAELRGFCEFCHAVVLSADLFLTSNACGFVQTLAEVFALLDGLHTRVLREATTCAQLTEAVLCRGRNLLSDVLGYLVLTVTDFPPLRSLEPVVLLGHLGPGGYLAKARGTDFGALVYALLRTAAPLFGIPVEGEEVRAEAALERTKERACAGQWHLLGLCKLLQKPEYSSLVLDALECFSLAQQLAFFLTRCMSEFARLSALFGDYGAISASRVLHPLLEQLSDLAGTLGRRLAALDEQLDRSFVLAPAASGTPASRLTGRRWARERLQRAVRRPASHVRAMQDALASLRAESDPDRLPRLRGELQESLGRLQGVFRSAEFLRYASPELLAVTEELLPRIAEERPELRGEEERGAQGAMAAQEMLVPRIAEEPELRVAKPTVLQLALAFAAPVRCEEAYMVASRVATALQLGGTAPLLALASARAELREELGEGAWCCEVRRAVLSRVPSAQARGLVAPYVADAVLAVTDSEPVALCDRSAVAEGARPEGATGGDRGRALCAELPPRSEQAELAAPEETEAEPESALDVAAELPRAKPEPLFAATVARMGRFGRRFVHDRRRVEVAGDILRIFAPHSATTVKLSVAAREVRTLQAGEREVHVRLPSGKTYHLRFEGPDTRCEFARRLLLSGAKEEDALSERSAATTATTATSARAL